MAHTLTELTQFDATVTVPDDGDPDVAASVAASGVGFQPLANRTQYIVKNLSDLVLSNTVVLSQSDTLHLLGGQGVVNINGAFLAIPNTSQPIGSTTASTWYYAYLYNNGAFGAAFEFSTTGPDASTGNLHKTSDTTRVFIGTFRSDGSSHAVAFAKQNHQVTYRMSGASIPPSHSISVPTSTSAFTTLDLSGEVPPTATLAQVRLTISQASLTNTLMLSIRTPGDTSNFQSISLPPITSGEAVTKLELIVTTVLSSAQHLEYQIGADPASSGSSASIGVLGYTE